MAFQPQPAPASFASTIKGNAKGRPNLLDNSEEIRDQIVEYVSEGLAFSEACSLVGISRSTMYDYMSAGAKKIREGDLDNEQATFFLRVKQAEAFAEKEHLDNVKKAGKIPAFWSASAWFLERKYPDRYGKQDRLNIQQTSRVDIRSVSVQQVITNADDRETIARYAELVLPAESSDDASGASGVKSDEWEVPIP